MLQKFVGTAQKKKALSCNKETGSIENYCTKNFGQYKLELDLRVIVANDLH